MGRVFSFLNWQFLFQKEAGCVAATVAIVFLAADAWNWVMVHGRKRSVFGFAIYTNDLLSNEDNLRKRWSPDQ